MSKEVIKQLIHDNNGMICADMVKRSGCGTWYLTDMVRKGELIRFVPGVYGVSYEFFDELLIFQWKNPSCVFSHLTALYFHGLTERYPYFYEVCSSRRIHADSFDTSVFHVHVVKEELLNVGVTTVQTAQGNTIRVYNQERCLCDLLRERDKQDFEIFGKAFRFYFASDDVNVTRLREYASIFGIEQQMEDMIVLMTTLYKLSCDRSDLYE